MTFHVFSLTYLKCFGWMYAFIFICSPFFWDCENFLLVFLRWGAYFVHKSLLTQNENSRGYIKTLITWDSIGGREVWAFWNIHIFKTHTQDFDIITEAFSFSEKNIILENFRINLIDIQNSYFLSSCTVWRLYYERNLWIRSLKSLWRK